MNTVPPETRLKLACCRQMSKDGDTDLSEHYICADAWFLLLHAAAIPEVAISE